MSKSSAEYAALVIAAVTTVAGGAYLIYMLSGSLAVPTLA